jgi:hypothetical protein
VHRRLYTPRQRRSHRRRQLLRDLILGAAVVAIAQLVAPRLPFVQQLEALPLVATAPALRPSATPTLGGTSPAATAQTPAAQTPPVFTTIEYDRGR